MLEHIHVLQDATACSRSYFEPATANLKVSFPRRISALFRKVYDQPKMPEHSNFLILLDRHILLIFEPVPFPKTSAF